MSATARLGRRGERYAARWLRRRGYRILHRNLVRGRGEADLVVVTPDRRTIVLVEVKTRAAAWPPPEMAVNGEKRRQLVRLAGILRCEPAGRGRAVRIDVLAIIWPAGCRPIVKHYEGLA